MAKGVLKSWYTAGAQNKDFGAVSQTDLTRSLVPSVAQANHPPEGPLLFNETSIFFCYEHKN